MTPSQQDHENPASPQQVDILLINPGSLKAVYQQLGEGFSAIETPSLAAFFATYMRNQGFSVAILDAPAYGHGPEECAQIALERYDPALVVMVVYGFQPSASTQNMPAAGATCRAIKEIDPHRPVLMTGTHPAALPEQTLREEAVDFVCSGEGPLTFTALAGRIKSGSTTYVTVPDLWYREGEHHRYTFQAPLIDNLDAVMPKPAFDLLPMDRYRAHNWHCFDHIDQRRPYASIHTSLGCPFKCSFCCINAPFGKPSYRTWSPDSVIQTITDLVETYGVRNIKFVDEMFVLNRSHVEGICDRIIEKGYGDKINIWAYARVDTVQADLLVKMRRAGFRWLALGIESGSSHVRDGVEKGGRGFDYGDILQVVRQIQAAGIYVIGNYIFGLPDDDLNSMRATLDLAIRANCEFANFYSAMAYPGSRLYTIARNKGWAMPGSWLGFSQHSFDCQPLPTDHISAAEVLRFRDDAFHTYFEHPDYLAMVERKFGPSVRDHLREMTRIRLPRRLYETPAPIPSQG